MDLATLENLRRRQGPTAEHPEVRLLVTARHRLSGHQDTSVARPPADPELSAVTAAARAWAHAESVWLTGGEPTLREDAPRLIAQLARLDVPELGMITDGLALSAATVASRLHDVGLRRVRVRLHSARSDAHDWLVGQKGAWKRTIKGIQLARAAGMQVEVQALLTRSTSPYAEELAELAARLGVRVLVLRRWRARGLAADDEVMLAPRLSMISGDVEAAIATGVRRGLRMVLEDLPRCAAPGAKASVLPLDAVVWCAPDTPGFAELASFMGPQSHLRGCAGCPGRPECVGAPRDYVRRFGRTEIDSESNRVVNPGTLPPTPLQGGDVRPPPRGGRFPPMRLAYVRAASRLPSLGGDPLVALVPQSAASSIRMVFRAPHNLPEPFHDHDAPAAPESSREIRVRLVAAAQHGAKRLRIASAGSLWHPEAPELLRECTRLELPAVEVAGDLSPVAGWSDMQLRRLRGVTRCDGALLAPTAEAHDAIVGREGAYEATLTALDRLSVLVPGLQIGVYAVIHDASQIHAWLDAWRDGELPGQPWFRLAAAGGSLRALAEVAAALPAGAGRDALAAVLPRALLDAPAQVASPAAEPAWGGAGEPWAIPSGSDRFGCYTDRLAQNDDPTPGHCPGFAEGWHVGDSPGSA